MLVSLYSAPDAWVIVPAKGTPPGQQSVSDARLTFEGTVPSELISPHLWPRLRQDCEEKGFASIPEDLGLTLLELTLTRYGSLVVEDPPTTAGP